MTDARRFCWGALIGMGATKALFEIGVEQVPNAMLTPGEAMLSSGLALGCVAVIWVGKREKPDA